MRSTRYLASFGITLGIVATAASDARAQQQGFTASHFEPSERGSDWFANESLDLRGKFRPAIGVVGDYSYRGLVAYNPDGSIKNSIVEHALLTHVGASFVFVDRLRLSASIPFQLYGTGDSTDLNGVRYLSPKNEQGVGDLRAALDLRLLGEYGDAFTLGIGAQVFFPTGQQENYLSDGEFRIRPRAMVAGDIGIFTYAAQAGFFYTGRNERVSGTNLGNQLSLGGAIGLRLANKKLTIGPEAWTTTVLDDAFGKFATPVEGILGAHYLIADAVRVGAGFGGGLTQGIGAPEMRGLLSLEWAPSPANDTDGDGVNDSEDACVNTPGERTDDPRTNGCPADRDQDGIYDSDDACVDEPGVRTDDPSTNGCPADRDKDGVYDTVDACPDLAGVKTSDPKTNGCPADSDKDGIFDADDACPDVPGVKTDDPKTNGCPADRDKDGVIDSEDACPDVAGLKTSDPKTNGCPDPDRDKDGIPNDVDACPDEPGKADKDPKRNGCPKAFVKEGKIEILDQVKFKTGSAQILPGKDSEEVLQAVLKILTDHPELKKVHVEGHTDNVGSPANNKKLSGDRAASVVKWLVAHGVDKSRLDSEGFGQERPIGDNKTEEGRRINRRVEFRIEAAAQGAEGN